MTEERTLESMGLYEGMSVEVLTLDNSLIFQGKIEKLQDAAVQVSDSMGRELVPVLLNRELKIRCFPSDTQVLILRGQICGSTKWFWKMDRMKILHVQEKRGFFRQRLSVKTTVYRAARFRESVECQIVDISAGGLLLKSKVQYQLGEELIINSACIVPEERDFSFHCRIRRSMENGREYLYGCQFEGLPSREQDRLLRAIFIMQRKERQVRSRQNDL